MPARRVLSVTGDVAFQLLRLTAASADVFPPLRSVAGGALHIAELVKKFHSEKEHWRELGTYVADMTASVVHSLAQANGLQEATKRNIMTLKAALDEVGEYIKKEQESSWHKRVGGFLKDPEKVADLRRKLDDAVGLFHLSTATAQVINVENILANVATNSSILSAVAENAAAIAAETKGLTHEASKQGLATTLGRLTRVQGASWDPTKGCMPDTRVALLSRVEQWINSSGQGSGGSNVMLLTAVAGAGKSTLAHTIAKQSADADTLGSSFFFDRDTVGRDSPAALFATIAADLGGRYPALGYNIAEAIEADPSLPSAPVSRQFESLVLDPCRNAGVMGPIVIVIDGLDEAWSDDLLDILCDQAPLLPGVFRLFVTCRMRPELERLCDAAHVEWADLDISQEANLRDMEIYAPSRLRRLAKGRKALGEDWPGEDLRRRFIERAGGLFLWVDVVCKFLEGRSNVPSELDKLMTTAGATTSTAEARMDKLYAAILENFDWTDDEFVADYRRVLGTAIASRVPLSVAAMQELYAEQTVASEDTLQRLGSLLTGVTETNDRNRPVRVLHQSLRDFVADRAYKSDTWSRFRINTEEHDRVLGILSLRLVNRGLQDGMPGTGYSTTDQDVSPGVPKMPGGAISEGLSYACLFWLDHVHGMSGDDRAVAELDKLRRTKVVQWLEVTASLGRCRGPRSALDSIKVKDQGGPTQVERVEHGDSYASICGSLSVRLAYEGRREEALEMSLEAVHAHQELAERQPDMFAPALARSLGILSVYLSAMGRREDALTVITDAVELHQRLVVALPAKFTDMLAQSSSNGPSGTGRPENTLAAEDCRQLVVELPVGLTADFASSLNNMATCLSALGRHEDALVAIGRAIELHRQLASELPATFNPVLAQSLNNLCNRLFSVGRHEDALAAMQQAVDLHRKLSAERPAAFMPNFACSLHNLAACLSAVGRRKDALAAIEQAVELRRQLVAERPAAFTFVLARSLVHLSTCLAAMGRRGDALVEIKQAVELNRQLVAERPAVFTPDLAQALHNLAGHLSGANHYEDALAAIKEAVELYRRLAAERPAAFIGDLARSLISLHIRLDKLERGNDALAVIQEAVELHRQLAANRYVVAPDLARALTILAEHLHQVERH